MSTVKSPNEPTTKTNDEKFCSECAAKINSKAEICPKCGVRQAIHHTRTFAKPDLSLPVAPNGKSKVMAGALGIFAGGFGVHKFYLGKIGLGILYLLFFWTLIPFIVGFIEGFLLIAMTDEDFNKKYGGA